MPCPSDETGYISDPEAVISYRNGFYIEQYAQRLIRNGPYHPNFYCNQYRLPGKCKKYPAYGDDDAVTYIMKLDGKRLDCKKEYAPQDVDPFGAEHYILVGFMYPVIPQDVYIFETLSPGSVVRILGKFRDSEWKLLWEGPPQICPQESRKFNPTIRKLDSYINILRVEFNGEHLRKHKTAIDAVLLTGHKTPKSLLRLKNFFPSLVRVHAKKTRQVHVDESSDLFSRLPIETILLIFQYLDLESLSKCAQVNKTWNKIAQHPILYCNLSLKRYWHKVDEKTLNFFKGRCKQLKKLDLTWCNDKAGRFIDEFLDGCDQLTHLSLCDCASMGWHTLTKISNFGEITELHVTCTYSHNFKCLSKLNKLITLDLSYTDISNESLIEILKGNPNLRHLILDCCLNLDELHVLATVVSTFNKNLRVWSSYYVNRQFEDSKFEEPHFADCEYLEVLELGWCFINDTHPGDLLEKIAVNCTNLRRLGISHWTHLNDEMLLPVIKYCENLSELDVSGNEQITAGICRKALMSLPNLKLLISSCSSISNEQVSAWRQDYPHVTIERTARVHQLP